MKSIQLEATRISWRPAFLCPSNKHSFIEQPVPVACVVTGGDERAIKHLELANSGLTRGLLNCYSMAWQCAMESGNKALEVLVLNQYHLSRDDKYAFDMLCRACELVDKGEDIDPDLVDCVRHNLKEYRAAPELSRFQVCFNEAEAMLRRGDFEAAGSAAAEAEYDATRTFCGTHWWTAFFLHTQGLALQKQGRVEEASRKLRAAWLIIAEWDYMADYPQRFHDDWINCLNQGRCTR